MGRLSHTAPSLRLFVPSSLTVCHLSFLPWAVLATSVIGVSRGDHSPSAPSLDQHVPSGSLISYQQVRVITVIKIFLLSSQSLFQHNHPNFSSHSLTHISGGYNSLSGWCSHISGPYYVNDFFFRFGGGLPLHKVHFLILRNPTVDLPTRSPNFSPVVFPNVWITFPVLSRRSSFGSPFLVLLLPCCVARCLLRSARDFEVPLTALFLVRVFPTTQYVIK
jgi:hypothetical protein